MNEPIKLNANPLVATPGMSGDPVTLPPKPTEPAPQEGPPVEIQVKVGTDRRNGNVTLIMVVKNHPKLDEDMTIGINYAPKEAAALAMSLVKAAQAGGHAAVLEPKAKRPTIVLPPGVDVSSGMGETLKKKVKRPRR